MRVLDLFSGIGGFSRGLERAGMTTVAFCEQDKFCQKVLKKHWPNVPIFDDVKELTYEQLQNDGIKTIELICAGFPCQPFSVAGRREGSQDKKGRDLWPDLFRIIQEVRPRFFIGENVQGFIGMEMGLTRTLVDLEEKAGYEVEVFLLGACSVGAPHKRLRCFIVAHLADSSRKRLQGAKLCDNDERKIETRPPGATRTTAQRGSDDGEYRTTQLSMGQPDDGLSEGLSRSGINLWDGDWERGVPRVATRQKDRVNKLRALGNSVVVPLVQVIGQTIMEADREMEN